MLLLKSVNIQRQSPHLCIRENNVLLKTIPIAFQSKIYNYLIRKKTLFISSYKREKFEKNIKLQKKSF